MYNRYVSQPDGSFRRSRLPEAVPPPHPKPQEHREQSPPPPPPKDVPRGHPPLPPPRNMPPRKKAAPDNGNVLGFLRQLLPRDFNTEDLLIVLLLLLMSGDCREDQNTALLTLVMYLFL